jgi:hypothetical protein
MTLRQVWTLLKQTFSESHFNQVNLLASSLAYYTVFSLAPLMVIVIAILGVIFGEATGSPITPEEHAIRTPSRNQSHSQPSSESHSGRENNNRKRNG